MNTPCKRRRVSPRAAALHGATGRIARTRSIQPRLRRCQETPTESTLPAESRIGQGTMDFERMHRDPGGRAVPDEHRDEAYLRRISRTRAYPKLPGRFQGRPAGGRPNTMVPRGAIGDVAQDRGPAPA